MKTTRTQHLLNTPAAALVIGLRPQTLRSLRMKGGGPVYVKLSANRVGYSPDDLREWIRLRRMRSTGESA